MKHISQPVVKKDAYALLSGKPVYTGDMVPKDALILKLLRSPHAYARIKAIDTSAALKMPGVVAVYTWKDVPDVRFTLAGQTLSLIHILKWYLGISLNHCVSCFHRLLQA